MRPFGDSASASGLDLTRMRLMTWRVARFTATTCLSKEAYHKVLPSLLSSIAQGESAAMSVLNRPVVRL